MKKKNDLSAGQVSLICGISEKTIKKLAKEGELPCVFVNRRPLFRLNVLIKHFERLERGAA